MVLIFQDPSPESCPERQITPPLGSRSEPTDAPSSLAPVGGVGGADTGVRLPAAREALPPMETPSPPHWANLKTKEPDTSGR